VFNKIKKYNKLLDRELINSYKTNSDLNALGELVARYTHLVASIALGILKNEQKAKNAVQEIFEIIITNLKDYDVKNFNALVYSTTKFHCFKVKNEHKSAGLENDLDEFLEKELLLQKRIKLIEKFMENLNSNQKKCIELFYFEGFSYSEIVKETEFSIEEVKSYIQTGKKNIKFILEKSES
tara:strand:- start:445 stop:990 length:546 start_codon:yes stop_codon:yes gene_type:complete